MLKTPPRRAAELTEGSILTTFYVQPPSMVARLGIELHGLQRANPIRTERWTESPSFLPRLSREAWTPCWEKLNKLEWCDRFAITSYGVNLGVRVNDPALLPMLRERLLRDAEASDADVVDRYFSVILGGEVEGTRISKYHLLYANHTLLARSLKLEEVLEAFESWFRLGVAELTDRRVFVHAGVVGYQNRAIIIPGKTFAGKTSLVVELVKAGATYYSDDFAVLDPQGMVHPFHKPLSLREPGGDGKQINIAVEEIGGRAGSEPLPVGLVLASEYKPGSHWSPRQLSPGQGTLVLLANTVPARRSPERVLDTLGRVVAAAPVLTGKRGEAAETARRILDILGDGGSRAVIHTSATVDHVHQ